MADDPRIDAARERARRIATREQTLQTRRARLGELQGELTEVDQQIAGRTEARTRVVGQIAQTEEAITQALERLERALNNQPDSQ